jgi:hypothetical protein
MLLTTIKPSALYACIRGGMQQTATLQVAAAADNSSSHEPQQRPYVQGNT